MNNELFVACPYNESEEDYPYARELAVVARQ